jgi:hypothetical protein
MGFLPAKEDAAGAAVAMGIFQAGSSGLLRASESLAFGV